MFFFFNDTATTEIYTLSLHDALPISVRLVYGADSIIQGAELEVQGLITSNWSAGANVSYVDAKYDDATIPTSYTGGPANTFRSEEHTSELQSQSNLVCRLLLEKKTTG